MALLLSSQSSPSERETRNLVCTPWPAKKAADIKVFPSVTPRFFFYSVTCYTKVFPLSNQVFPLCYTNLFLSVTARSSHLLQQGFPLCHTKVFPSVTTRFSPLSHQGFPICYTKFPLCHTKVFLSVIPRFSHLLYQGLPLCHTKVFPSVTPRFFPFVTPRFPPFVTGQRRADGMGLTLSLLAQH